MLDLVGAIAGMMAVAINLVALTNVLAGPLACRLGAVSYTHLDVYKRQL